MDQRRTVRAFSADPVPEQVVLDAIAVASTAPSGAHQQPWTFVLVQDPQVRAKIRELTPAQYQPQIRAVAESSLVARAKLCSAAPALSASSPFFRPL